MTVAEFMFCLGQQKSEFMETVTLRKVEGVRTSSPAADSTATRKPGKSIFFGIACAKPHV
jgi:hypothetical protein